ncbi:DUF5107 domain-containing protein [Arthrobacter sp. HMWF013]|uniref:DUF5107 domain-containing protein n=1 Tax=Arthrobacter sp. HMWF013 TaxID=2056849 RepID=UPI000D38215F|nr:DUF5107 domain-containing protein [Arthrobacter sp. HMWF013]PTT61097.1 DUF5107 domain-containing protein [Arthrobacter sp. HMWF013]
MIPDEPQSRINLPDAPPDQQAILAHGGVACWSEPVSIDTYAPGEPDRYPLFLDRRVYQGSSGKVYPMPFIDSIAAVKEPRLWQAIHVENEYVRLMLLPEIGGRIHIGFDKTADYDFFYRNNVIKPGLVGLAGPWISGGVEFNWPQHHRPATFLPVETSVERGDDGPVTVWHSDLDPLQRMRGTHGVRLRPGSSLVEVEARLYNCTDVPQTFLWWANVAARAHGQYQSFFPTDVHHVADHARRAITAFPQADRPYYGVDYPALAATGKPDADRIDFYANIPVPTSYMITDTEDSFFGGYDQDAEAGFVHWADRSISPGKKQWTWGNGPVGRAWDAHLTDDDGPYVELMAGVFTDNQPDFSYLAPGETRTFSEFWYPIRDMGPAHQANVDAAVSLHVDGNGRTATMGVATTALHEEATVLLKLKGTTIRSWTVRISPARPFQEVVELGVSAEAPDLTLQVLLGTRELISWTPRKPVGSGEAKEPWVATEPDLPAAIDSQDELYFTGTHLTQNRHPTRSPLPYFAEMLRRDPLDSRAATALGAAVYKIGDFDQARELLETAVARLTRRNLNPPTGEASYRLGLILERTGQAEAAAERFGKAAWDRGWAHPAQLALARLALRSGRPAEALRHAEAAAALEAASPEAKHLLVLALRRLGRTDESRSFLQNILLADPLDPVALALDGSLQASDPKTALAVACWLARAGQWQLALDLTEQPGPSAHQVFGNPEPLRHFLRATWLEELLEPEAASAERSAARRADTTYAFPYGLDDYDALHRALEADPRDKVAHGLLGCWLLDAGRTEDALKHLRTAMTHGSADPVVWRNAALATVNTGGDTATADSYFERALELSPDDARLVFERAVLAGLRGLPVRDRIAGIERHSPSVLSRDDLTLLYANLLIDAGRADEALDILSTRSFQPFEGGEGMALDAYDRAAVHCARTLMSENPTAAITLLREGMEAPANLGEGRHPAHGMAERLVALGDALELAGDRAAATGAWDQACQNGNALAVHAAPAGPSDFWRGVAHVRLGRHTEAEGVWRSLVTRADELESAPAAPDYFATSLPELLLFDTDTASARTATARSLRELAAQGRLEQQRVRRQGEHQKEEATL